MKLKNVLFVLTSGMLVACSSNDEGLTTSPANPELVGAPGTEVYIGVDNLKNFVEVGATTRAAENPLAPVADVSYFNVKVDPRLGYNIAPNTYVTVVNNGKLYTDCPFITINDGNDYNYLFSTNGTGLRTLIAAGDTATTSIMKTLASYRTKAVAPTVVEDNIHVIWYLSKNMNNGWHVDGLLTDKVDIKDACDACRDEGYGEITFGKDGKQLTYSELIAYLPMIQNIKPLDKTLNVDIHQQTHTDWGEIKTSVHIKEAKDVEITIPVSKEYTIDSTDTNEVVKYFEKLYEVQNFEKAIGAKVNVTVKREDTGVTINITGITDELLKALERRYNDGLTVEIHTFYRLTDKEGKANYKPQVWEQMKRATVIYDGNVKGQITSAYMLAEKVEINK